MLGNHEDKQEPHSLGLPVADDMILRLVPCGMNHENVSL